MVEGLTGIKTIHRESYEQKQFEHVSNQVRNFGCYLQW